MLFRDFCLNLVVFLFEVVFELSLVCDFSLIPGGLLEFRYWHTFCRIICQQRIYYHLKLVIKLIEILVLFPESFVFIQAKPFIVVIILGISQIKRRSSTYHYKQNHACSEKINWCSRIRLLINYFRCLVSFSSQFRF